MHSVIYARYSSDNQREASIDDQVRVCREHIERQGWNYLHAYTDRALSGASALRPGYQKLLEDARNGAFEVVVAEALDRLSRDQEDVAGLYKRLSFCDVKIVTLAEGEISDLHVGLKGTMNALFLKDLAQKTRRGLEGRIRQGRSGGGLCYGYKVVHAPGPDGTPIRGGRRIIKAEAKVVRRIFEDFAAGQSPKTIAHTLNREGVPGPRGQPWGPSTIYGNWRRGTGILNNELYIGRLVWNRQRFIKDPESGKRIAKLNPEADWIVQKVPELRIIPDELWREVKQRQATTRALLVADRNGVRAERARRPVYLLSGLLKCGACGGGMSKISTHHYGCSNARNRGTCDNRLTMRRDVLEESVLAGIKSRLMHPDLVKEFIAEYYREFNRLAATRDAERQGAKRQLAKVEREIREMIDAIKSGIRSPTMAAELDTLEERKSALQKDMDGPPAPPVRLHPNLAEVYRQKVENLREALNDEGSRAEATAILRDLIDEVRLIPKDGELAIYLVGDLAAILELCAKKDPGALAAGVQITLVAGARNHLDLLLTAGALSP
jgi:DNA invertase Pin-like site-specific DNA recombinase